MKGGGRDCEDRGRVTNDQQPLGKVGSRYENLGYPTSRSRLPCTINFLTPGGTNRSIFMQQEKAERGGEEGSRLSGLGRGYSK